MIEILVYRDPRESPRKCSLTPIRGRPGVRFVNYHRDRRLAAGECVLLHPDGEELSSADRGRSLLLVDCSWRHLPALLASLDGAPRRRRLPAFASAYPRKSKLFDDPERGLASIEALFAATVLLGEPRPDLLEGYRWTAEFLAANPGLDGPWRERAAGGSFGPSGGESGPAT